MLIGLKKHRLVGEQLFFETQNVLIERTNNQTQTITVKPKNSRFLKNNIIKKSKPRNLYYLINTIILFC